MRRIVILGMPGSGKSTQGRKLADFLGCKWISTGELLRNSTEPWIVEKLKTAELFDDGTVTGLLKTTLEGQETAIIDGYPRTAAQAETATGELGVDKVIELVIPEEEAKERLSKRGRAQDVEKVITERIGDYKRMKTEILGIFREKGVRVTEVDGIGTEEEVFNKLKEVL